MVVQNSHFCTTGYPHPFQSGGTQGTPHQLDGGTPPLVGWGYYPIGQIGVPALSPRWGNPLPSAAWGIPPSECGRYKRGITNTVHVSYFVHVSRLSDRSCRTM